MEGKNGHLTDLEDGLFRTETIILLVTSVASLGGREGGRAGEGKEKVMIERIEGEGGRGGITNIHESTHV